MLKRSKNDKKVIATISIILLAFIAICLIAFKNLNSWKEDGLRILYDNDELYYKLERRLAEEDFSEDSKMAVSDGVADSVIHKVIDDLVNNLGYSKKKAIKLINNGGLTVYSTLNKEIQSVVSAEFNKNSTFSHNNKMIFNQAAMVIMDYSGQVKALATGNGNDTKRNRATGTLLQVGSTIKPIAIYSLAIEMDLINYSSIIEDKPIINYYLGESTLWPSNYDNRYETNVTIAEALRQSKNTIAVRVGEMTGEEKIYEFLKNELDYENIDNSDSATTDQQLAALALGYFNKGITLDKLVSSYEIFGNGGYYSESTIYKKIIDKNKDIIIEVNSNAKQVISNETSTIMNRLLYNNMNGNKGNKNTVKEVKLGNCEVIGKTGTVGNDNDENISQLFVGGTPEYIAGVWVGNDDKTQLFNNKYKGPMDIWQNIMQKINIVENKFQLADNVVSKEYCIFTGLIKGENCKSSKKGYYKPNDNTATCDSCK